MINSPVELIHPGTQEIKSLFIETVQRTYVTIRWGMSGLYDIHLKQNVMIARSIKARRKGKCLWKVKDIDKLRCLVDDHFKARDREQLDFSYDKHVKSMPHQIKKPI